MNLNPPALVKNDHPFAKMSAYVFRFLHRSPKSQAKEPRRLRFETLEPRVLFSAAPVPAEAPPEPAEPVAEHVAPAQPAAPAPPAGAGNPGPTGVNSQPAESKTDLQSVSEESASAEASENQQVANLSHLENSPSSPAQPLTPSALQEIAQAAAQRWVESGLSEAQTEVLANAVYQIQDLEGAILGFAQGNLIVIDSDAAGTGEWFIDSTPLEDSEFENLPLSSSPDPSVSPSQQRHDLLTVLLHEQGHLLGLRDTADDPQNLMHGTLEAGVRKLPVSPSPHLSVSSSPQYLLAASTPPSNDTDHAVNDDISLTFTNPPATAPNATNFVVHGQTTTPGQNQGTLAGTYSANGNQVTFDPAGELAGGQIVEVTATAALDGTASVLQFRTATTPSAGTFVPGGQLTGVSAVGAQNPPAVGDVDGDGDQDLYMPASHPDRAPSALWINDGNGNYTKSAQVFPGDTNYTSAHLADLDGDGDLDLIQGNGYPSPSFITPPPGVDVFRVLLNDGSGTFTLHQTLADSGGQRGGTGQAIGDVDGDGDLDVIAAAGDGRGVYFNDGTGTFTLSNQIILSSHAPVFADLDGDGDLDLFAAGRFGTGTGDGAVYLNDGSGNFTTTGQILGIFPKFAAAGDVDGDGDADLITQTRSGIYTGTTQVWLNDGSGNLTDSGISITESNAAGLAVGDLDGDGDLDIVGQQVHLNTGNGTFVATSDFFTTPNVSGKGVTRDGAPNLTLADVDGDGDLDGLAGIRPDSGIPANDFTQILINQNEVDLSIAKNAPDSVFPGGTIVYTVTVTGDPNRDVTGVEVADSLTTSNPILSAITPSGGATTTAIPGPLAGGNLNTTVDLPAGSSIVFTLTGVAAGGPGTVFTTNPATVTIPANATVVDRDPSNNTATDNNVVAALTADVDLSVSKTVSTTDANGGDTVTYTTTLTADAATSFTDFPFTDLFDPALQNLTLTGIAPSGGATTTATVGAIAGGNLAAKVDLPAGSSLVFTVTGEVPAGPATIAGGAVTLNLPATANANETDTSNNTATPQDVVVTAPVVPAPAGGGGQGAATSVAPTESRGGNPRANEFVTPRFQNAPSSPENAVNRIERLQERTDRTVIFGGLVTQGGIESSDVRANLFGGGNVDAGTNPVLFGVVGANQTVQIAVFDADGERIDTVRVTAGADGVWRFAFGDLDLSEGGVFEFRVRFGGETRLFRFDAADFGDEPGENRFEGRLLRDLDDGESGQGKVSRSLSGDLEELLE